MTRDNRLTYSIYNDRICRKKGGSYKLGKLNVCYTIDQSYFQPMMVSIYSLLKNNTNLDITIYLIYDGLSETHFKLLEETMSLFPNTNLKKYSADSVNKKIEQLKIPNWRGARIPNARLFLQEIIFDCPDSLLYLDSDTIIVGSLEKFANKKQKEAIVAVKDRLSKDYLNNLCPILVNYFNMWDNIKGYDKIIEVIKKDYPLFFPDQDIINIAFQNHIEVLPLEYNLFPYDIYMNYKKFKKKFLKPCDCQFYNKEEYNYARENPIILHATPFFGVRTWEENKIHPYQQIYLTYLKEIFGTYTLEKSNIIYANIHPQLFKIMDSCRLYVPKYIQENIKKLLYKKDKNM